MTLLDDVAALAAADPSDALGAVEGSPAQWLEGVARGRAVEALPSADGIRNVVVLGMGGSGVAGDVLQAVAAPVASVPVAVVKGYDVPAWVGPGTLAFCASYSGNTEETLSCYEQARERGARIVAVTTGGRLAELAREHGYPHVSPVAGGQPRAALPSLAAPLLVVCERLGILPALGPTLEEAHEALTAVVEQCRRDVPQADNPAKRLAAGLDGTIPLVWGQDGPLAVAAMRWRAQINENAKMPAFSSVLPELDHNELVGYDPGVPALERVALIVLRAPDEHPRVSLRIDTTLGLMRDKVGAVAEAWGSGSSALARLLSVVLVGDFVSVYLALLRGVDPTPVHVIEGLKKQLASA